MNTFRVTTATLFVLAVLSPTGCVLSDAPEGDEHVSLEFALSTDEAAADGLADDPASMPLGGDTTEEFGTEGVCQPGTYQGPCADWGAGAYESQACGPGNHTWSYTRCKQYRDPSGKYYREQCGGQETWCDFTPQPWGTNDCLHTC